MSTCFFSSHLRLGCNSNTADETSSCDVCLIFLIVSNEFIKSSYQIVDVGWRITVAVHLDSDLSPFGTRELLADMTIDCRINRSVNTLLYHSQTILQMLFLPWTVLDQVKHVLIVRGIFRHQINE